MNHKAFKLVYAACIAALTYVFTALVRVPMAMGYIHIGDAMLFIGVFLIGAYAIPAAALGACLADLLGYPVFALPTLAIKLLAAFTCYLIIRKKDTPLFVSLGAVVGSIVNMLGYFLVEIPMFSLGAAVAEIPMNAIQAAFAIGITAIATVSLTAVQFKKRIKL